MTRVEDDARQIKDRSFSGMAIRREGIYALFSFFAILSLNFCFYLFFDIFRSWILYLLIQGSFLLFIGTISTLKTSISAVVWRSAILGLIFSFGLTLVLSLPPNSPWLNFAQYLIVLSFFHWSEYVCTALSNPSALNLDSFLLNHSKEYWIALAASWVEYFVELYFISSLKLFRIVSAVGLLVCVIGEILRKLAMLTAGRGFTHLIAYRKKPEHHLVTTGVYSLFRHPSYVGWFWWSIGTQILLCNPICFCAYTIISWMFFKDRIYHEEIVLINFFGEHYVDYQKRVPSGLPGIRGYQLF